MEFNNMDIHHLNNSLTRLKKETGYTIVEVMIAISILTVGILAVGAMQTAAIKSNSTAGNITKRTTMAQDKLEYLMSLPFDSHWLDPAGNPPNPDSTGETHMDIGSGYSVSWNVTVHPSVTNALLINVTVTKSGKTTTIKGIKSQM